MKKVSRIECFSVVSLLARI